MYFNRKPFPRPSTLVVCTNKQQAIYAKQAFNLNPQDTYFCEHMSNVGGRRFSKMIVFDHPALHSNGPKTDEVYDNIRKLAALLEPTGEFYQL